MFRSLPLCWLLAACAVPTLQSDEQLVAGAYTMFSVDIWPHLVLEEGGRFRWCVERNFIVGPTTTGRWAFADGIVRLSPDEPIDFPYSGSLRAFWRDGRCVLVPAEVAAGFDFDHPHGIPHFMLDASSSASQPGPAIEGASRRG